MSRSTALRIALPVAGVLCGLVASSAHAATYGLVVGINAYRAPVPELAGAVNDAEDIAAALQRAGATRVIKLVDGEATRAAVIAGWNELFAAATKGDTIVFTYAGHGAQEPASADDGDEADGLNENFLLVGYGETGPAVAERLVDNEVAQWLKDAADKGVRVVFVADSCHSGTMFRSVSLGLRYRNAPRLDIDMNALADFAPPVPKSSETIGADEPVTFLAAVPEDRLAPELMIDGVPRGGLSYAFARSLEGAADLDRDGRVTEQELTTYVRTVVQIRSDSQQITQSFPPRSRAIEVLSASGDAGGGALAQNAELAEAVKIAEAAAVAEPIRLAFRNGGSEAVDGAEIVEDEASADLVYDASARTVEKRVAGIVAEDVERDGLPGIVAKWRAIAYLKAAAGQGVQPFDVASGPRTYARGERLTVALGDTARPYMTLFNLPPNGRVEFLYPTTEQERAEDWRGRDFSLPLVVRDPPFGAEHLIAVMSDAPLDALHTDLRSLKAADAATALPEVLSRALDGQSIALGIADVYTSAGN